MTSSPEASAQPTSGDTPDDSVLSIEIGGKTIGANLEAAIAAGRVVRTPDGKLELVETTTSPTSIRNDGEFNRNCQFLNGFMFTHVYGKKAVPIACSDCYKVKVAPETLRQLMAVTDIAAGFPCAAKSQSEVNSRENQSLYGTYFYLLGLDKARAVYKKLRGEIDAHPKLGPAAKMIIKRGCTNYERACGPSDRYTFDPRLARIEEYFRARFVRQKPRSHPKKYRDAMVLLDMIESAYRIGDNTYKDFTGGKDLHSPTVTYDPDAPATAGDDAAAETAKSVAGRHSISR